jgi:hypothetical protein
MTGTGMLEAGDPVGTGDQLSMFLASPDNPARIPFTRLLLQLAAEALAAPVQLDRLRRMWPDEVITWELWSALEETPSAGELAGLVTRARDGGQGIPARHEILAVARDYSHGRIAL